MVTVTETEMNEISERIANSIAADANSLSSGDITKLIGKQLVQAIEDLERMKAEKIVAETSKISRHWKFLMPGVRQRLLMGAAISDTDFVIIVNRLKEMAKEGDAAAMHELLNRYMGKADTVSTMMRIDSKIQKKIEQEKTEGNANEVTD